MKPIFVTPRADEDIDRLARTIAHFSFAGAARFYLAVQAAFEELQRRPDAGTNFSGRRSGQLRVWPIPSFRKYLIFYRELPKALEVVRIIHGSQDWQSDFEVGQSG